MHRLYDQGRFFDGEELCVDILEVLGIDWNSARVFLVLNLAAQEAEEEALSVIYGLDQEALKRATEFLTDNTHSATDKLVLKNLKLRTRELKQEKKTQPQSTQTPPGLPYKYSPDLKSHKALRRVRQKLRDNRHPAVSKEPLRGNMSSGSLGSQITG